LDIVSLFYSDGREAWLAAALLSSIHGRRAARKRILAPQQADPVKDDSAPSPSS
jgi:hypothetical protein